MILYQSKNNSDYLSLSGTKYEDETTYVGTRHRPMKKQSFRIYHDQLLHILIIHLKVKAQKMSIKLIN